MFVHVRTTPHVMRQRHRQRFPYTYNWGTRTTPHVMRQRHRHRLPYTYTRGDILSCVASAHPSAATKSPPTPPRGGTAGYERVSSRDWGQVLSGVALQSEGIFVANESTWAPSATCESPHRWKIARRISTPPKITRAKITSPHHRISHQQNYLSTCSLSPAFRLFASKAHLRSLPKQYFFLSNRVEPNSVVNVKPMNVSSNNVLVSDRAV